MNAFSLANVWFRKHVFFKYGIDGSLTLDDDGIALVFLFVGEEYFMLRSYSWTHLISRMKTLLPELVPLMEPLTPIDRANLIIERELTDRYGIPVFVGGEGDEFQPWAMIHLGEEHYNVRAFNWVHLVRRVRQLIPELVTEERPAWPGESESI